MFLHFPNPKTTKAIFNIMLKRLIQARTAWDGGGIGCSNIQVQMQRMYAVVRSRWAYHDAAQESDHLF